MKVFNIKNKKKIYIKLRKKSCRLDWKFVDLNMYRENIVK